MIKWIKDNQTALVRNSFLLPILLVVIMSISHVVSWYDLGNPISWAIYLSIAIEIFALASISAAGIKASKTAIWILFGIVTTIQILGNIFYEFKNIDVNGDGFKSWVSLIEPFFLDWDIMDHRRFLAIVQGGTLPIMSLTALHFYIQFQEKKEESKEDIIKKGKDAELEKVWEKAKEIRMEREAGMTKDEIQEMDEDEPTALANSQYRKEIKEDPEYWDDLYEKLNEEERAAKESQRELLSEIMKADEETGLYDTGDLLNKKPTENNVNDSKEYINKTVNDRRIGKSDKSRPQKNWG